MRRPFPAPAMQKKLLVAIRIRAQFGRALLADCGRDVKLDPDQSRHAGSRLQKSGLVLLTAVNPNAAGAPVYNVELTPLGFDKADLWATPWWEAILENRYFQMGFAVVAAAVVPKVLAWLGW
jgi:hypothetical protein